MGFLPLSLLFNAPNRLLSIMTKIAIIDIKHGEQQARTIWNEIYDQDEQASAFMSWEWMDSWKNHFSGNREMQIIYARNRDGQPVAALPIMAESIGLPGFPFMKRFQLTGSDSLACSEHLGFLIKPGTETSILHQLLSYAWRHYGDRKYFRFSEIDNGSREMEIISEWSRTETLKQEFKSHGGCWQTGLPDSWDEFLAELSSNFRQQIRRHLRKIDNSTAFVKRQITERREVEPVAQKLMELNQKRMSGKGVNSCFNTKAMRDFFLEMSVEMVAAKKAWLDAIYKDEEVIAASLHLVDKASVSYYQGGFDEQFAKQKPMVVLFATAIQRAIQQKKKIYDFLGGNEAYKQRWGATLRPYTTISLLPSGVGQNSLIKLFELYHRVKTAKAYYFP